MYYKDDDDDDDDDIYNIYWNLTDLNFLCWTLQRRQENWNHYHNKHGFKLKYKTSKADTV